MFAVAPLESKHYGTVVVDDQSDMKFRVWVGFSEYELNEVSPRETTRGWSAADDGYDHVESIFDLAAAEGAAQALNALMYRRWGFAASRARNRELGGACAAEIHRLENELASCASALPGPLYMDPPDGGDVPVGEQLRRMALDAARYRWLRACNGGSIGITTFSADENLERALVEDEADAAIDAAMEVTPNAKQTPKTVHNAPRN